MPDPTDEPTAPPTAAPSGASAEDPSAARASAPPGEPTDGAPRRRSWGAVASVLAVLLVVAVAVAGVEWRRAADAGGERSTRRAVATAAGDFGEALLSYDYQNLTAARDRVVRLATDAFAQQYTAGFFEGLGSQVTSLKASASATVSRVYVSDVEGDTAKAVVAVDSEIRSSSSTQRRLGQYLDLALVKRGGAWKVDQVTYLGRLDAQTSGATTTTSAPSTTTSTPSSSSLTTATTALAPAPGGG